MFFLLLKENPICAYESLFFTETEKDIIHENLLESKTHPFKDREKFQLEALIYISEKIWSLWINNEIICPENVYKIKGYRIKKVTPWNVTFSWIPSNSSTPKTFTLCPYQAYDSKEQKIIDGLKN